MMMIDQTYRERKLLTVGQAARIIGIDNENGRRRVRRLIRSGKIRAEDHGTGAQPFWMIPESALRDYLADRGRLAPRGETQH